MLSYSFFLSVLPSVSFQNNPFLKPLDGVGQVSDERYQCLNKFRWRGMQGGRPGWVLEGMQHEKGMHTRG